MKALVLILMGYRHAAVEFHPLGIARNSLLLADADYACQVAQIFECTPMGCTPVTAAQANLPPAVVLNVREKRLFSGVFGGQGLFDPGDAYEDPNVLILHGRHGLLTWTAVVSKPTGQMSMSIANLGKTYAEFGACTPQP